MRLAEPPIEGRANKRLLVFLAEILGLPPSRLSIIRGQTGRRKVIEVDGLSREEIDQILGI